MAPGHCDISEASPPTLIPSRSHPNLLWECVRKGQGSPDEVRGDVKRRGRPPGNPPLPERKDPGAKPGHYNDCTDAMRCDSTPRVATSTAPVHSFSVFLLLSHCLPAPGLFFWAGAGGFLFSVFGVRARWGSRASGSGRWPVGFPPVPALGGTGSHDDPPWLGLHHGARLEPLRGSSQSLRVARQRP